MKIVVGTKDMKIASLQKNITADPGKSIIPKKKEEVLLSFLCIIRDNNELVCLLRLIANHI